MVTSLHSRILQAEWFGTLAFNRPPAGGETGEQTARRAARILRQLGHEDGETCRIHLVPRVWRLGLLGDQPLSVLERLLAGEAVLRPGYDLRRVPPAVLQLVDGMLVDAETGCEIWVDAAGEWHMTGSRSASA